jgi:hypothetical protein
MMYQHAKDIGITLLTVTHRPSLQGFHSAALVTPRLRWARQWRPSRRRPENLTLQGNKYRPQMAAARLCLPMQCMLAYVLLCLRVKRSTASTTTTNTSIIMIIIIRAIITCSHTLRILYKTAAEICFPYFQASGGARAVAHHVYI